MDELESLRAIMTDEQRAQHDLLCAALAAGVLTGDEQQEIERLARQGGEKWESFLASLRMRLHADSSHRGTTIVQ